MQPHIVPKSVYFTVAACLAVLLVVTVLAAQFDLGVANTPIAMAIALAKAALIVLFFMHVRYASPLVRVFAAGGFLWAGDYVRAHALGRASHGDCAKAANIARHINDEMQSKCGRQSTAPRSRLKASTNHVWMATSCLRTRAINATPSSTSFFVCCSAFSSSGSNLGACCGGAANGLAQSLALLLDRLIFGLQLLDSRKQFWVFL